MAWGGKREGAGRPVGWRKANPCQRKPHTVAAFDEEWALINRFAKLVKYGDKELSEKYLVKLEKEIND